MDKVIDPTSGRLVAWHLHWLRSAYDRYIWMDGRPHPSEYAPHTWEGFRSEWIRSSIQRVAVWSPGIYTGSVPLTIATFGWTAVRILRNTRRIHGKASDRNG